MTKLLNILQGRRQAAIIVACCNALSACSSGESVVSPPMDDTTCTNKVVTTAEPLFSSDSKGLQSFELLEDTQLCGRFFSETTPSAGPITIRSLPSNGRLTLHEDGAVFLYMANENYFGDDGFTYLTFENHEIDVSLSIAAVNDAPTLSTDFPRVADQGRVFEAQLEAFDADNDELRYTATGLPSWLQLDAATGYLTGFPTQSDVGITDNISFRVTDNNGRFAELKNVQIEVLDINDAPTLNVSQIPDELKARETIVARLFPDDLDGDAVKISLESNPFLEGRVNGGTLTVTVAEVNEVTETNLVILATDDQGLVAREIVPVTIYPLTSSGRGLTVLGSKQGAGVHLVLLGDGYAIDQQNQFREHVDQTLEQLGNDAGISEHVAAFNVHMITAVSVNSGADDNEQVDSRDTAFDSTYNCAGILRLICANTLKMFETALNEYPEVDQIVLLVNDERYGGSGNSGGSVAITSAFFPEVALHEMGHSLVGLADEYADTLVRENTVLQRFEEGRYRNVTALVDPELVPWAHWIDSSAALPQQAGDEGVGLFEGGFYRERGIFRPTFNSRMRTFDSPFGPVNSELWILRLYALTGGGVRSLLPDENIVSLSAGESQEFRVEPFFPESVQEIEWRVNGDRQLVDENNPNTLVVSPAVGTHTVTVAVRDITGKIRLPPPHAGIFNRSWELEVR